jgi:uncharacterized protein YjlB
MTAREVRARMAAEGLVAEPWSNGPFDTYARHAHDYDKVIVVTAGSIMFGVGDAGERFELGTGDRLELPAGTVHDALVGPAGVTCLEAHRPAGSLPAGSRRRAAGDW